MESSAPFQYIGKSFFENSPFSRTLSLSQMSLSASTLRHQAVANNIANVDTPHYKRKMITFESELNRVIAMEKETPLPFKVSDARHLPLEEPKHYSEVRANILEEFDSNYRNDKNNVDIEKEISDQVKTSLHYTAVSRILNNHFKRFKSVLT